MFQRYVWVIKSKQSVMNEECMHVELVSLQMSKYLWKFATYICTDQIVKKNAVKDLQYSWHRIYIHDIVIKSVYYIWEIMTWPETNLFCSDQHEFTTFRK